MNFIIFQTLGIHPTLLCTRGTPSTKISGAQPVQFVKSSKKVNCISSTSLKYTGEKRLGKYRGNNNHIFVLFFSWAPYKMLPDPSGEHAP